MSAPPATDTKSIYVLRLADDLLVNSQRLAEYMTHGPELEEELAIANVALDNLGAAQMLYEHAALLADDGRSADDLALLRTERDFVNCLLVEQPHSDFADVIARQFFLDAWHYELWPRLAGSTDSTIAGVAAKAAMEARYHFRHSSTWVIRLGDGTAESAARMQRAVDTFWRFTAELSRGDDVDATAAAAGYGIAPDPLHSIWTQRVTAVMHEARLQVPEDPYQATGGRQGRHTEHLGHLLAEMQFMARAYPGLQW